MKYLKKIIGIVLVGMFAFVMEANAQEDPTQNPESPSFLNPNSARPVVKYEQLYKVRVWRRMDLNEKINQSFFAFNSEITKIMIDAVKAGQLVAYSNDSLTENTRMTLEQFTEQLMLPGADEEEEGFDFGEEEEDDWFGGDEGEGEGEEELEISNEFTAGQITQLQLMEDVIFDKRRSTLVYDIQGMAMVIPGTEFETGVDRIVAWFKYVDLDRLFRSRPHEAVWFNRYNSAEHKNMAEAFLLRLFQAPLIKVQNPRNDQISFIHPDPKESIIFSQIHEMQLLEKEHNLWEY